MSAPQVDIIVKLRRNADSLNQAGHFAQAAAAMREAADTIAALRNPLTDAELDTLARAIGITRPDNNGWSESA